MRLLADENMPGSVIAELRARGHDVLSIKESMRGAGDPAVLARAQLEARVVLTQDKDFGELAYRAGLPAACGVILFRLTGDDPDGRGRPPDGCRRGNSEGLGRGIRGRYPSAHSGAAVTHSPVAVSPAVVFSGPSAGNASLKAPDPESGIVAGRARG